MRQLTNRDLWTGVAQFIILITVTFLWQITNTPHAYLVSAGVAAYLLVLGIDLVVYRLMRSNKGSMWFSPISSTTSNAIFNLMISLLIVFFAFFYLLIVVVGWESFPFLVASIVVAGAAITTGVRVHRRTHTKFWWPYLNSAGVAVLVLGLIYVAFVKP